MTHDDGDLVIREEAGSDQDAVRDLHLAAFADDPIVADLVDALRSTAAPLAPMSFVASVGTRSWAMFC